MAAQPDGNGTDGNRMLDFPFRTSPLQQVAELNTHPPAGFNPFPFNGHLLRTNENIGVVPIEEHFPFEVRLFG